MNGRRGIAGLVGVTALTLASGWIGHRVNTSVGEVGMQSAGAGIWITTPLAAVTAARLLGRGGAPGGWDPRTGHRWYAVAAATFPAVTGAALGLGRAAGWVHTDRFDGRRLTTSMVSSVGPGLLKNVLEEAVWRGYLTSELVDRRLPDPVVYLGTGLVWGLWHVPYYLYFLPEDQMREVLDVPRGVFALIATGTMVAWAVPFAELFRLSGSVWPCVVMHTVEDALNPLVLDGHARLAAERKALISPVVGLLPSVLHLAVGLALRAVRRRRG